MEIIFILEYYCFIFHYNHRIGSSVLIILYHSCHSPSNEAIQFLQSHHSLSPVLCIVHRLRSDVGDIQLQWYYLSSVLSLALVLLESSEALDITQIGSAVQQADIMSALNSSLDRPCFYSLSDLSMFDVSNRFQGKSTVIFNLEKRYE